MSHEIVRDVRRVFVRYTDEVTDREIAAAVAEIQAHPDFDRVLAIVHDFTACQRVRYSPRAMSEIAATDWAAALNKPEHRVAIIGDRPDVRGALEAYLDAGLHPESKFQVFADLESALRWVD